MSKTYTYRVGTDAVQFDIVATSAAAALRAVIAKQEWAELDSPRERREVADGAWLVIRSDDASDEIRRGTQP